MRYLFNRALAVLLAASVCVLAGSSFTAASDESTTTEGHTFGGAYAALSPAQKALVDDLFRRFAAITDEQVDPEQGYDRAPLSVRTTFDAVTHALTTSTLTDKETGEDLGRSVDLVDYLEDVRGRVTGAGGDRQFRLYVALKPEARELLERAEEFERKGDNTIFHKGYPLNYRQEGVPSMQVSMSRDGLRADIDVDYRSEKFPASLVNGHLTAANSDVRAGNAARHNGRWEGLVNWWEGFFGALFSGDSYGDEDSEARFPAQPRAGEQTIDVAVHDFLTSWLVEQRPNLAVAYFDRAAIDCLALRLEEEGQQIDRGLAQIQLYVRMKAVNEKLGKRDSLEDTIVGVRYFNPNFKRVRHDHHAQYVLQTVPNHLAEEMKCGSFTRVGELSQERTVSFLEEKPEYFLASFLVKGPSAGGATLNLLWQKREGFWKIVSYGAEVEAEEGPGLPDIAEDIPVADVATIEAPRGLIDATRDFYESWLLRKDYDRAMALLSPRSYACAALLTDAPADGSADSYEARIRRGVERTGAAVGDAEDLAEVMDGVTPWDPRVRIVEHRLHAAYGLFGLPNWAGEQAACERMVARGGAQATEAEGQDESFGRHFVSATQFDTVAGETAVLYLGWEQEADDWKVFAFKLVEP